jgi:hypothetical protein
MAHENIALPLDGDDSAEIHSDNFESVSEEDDEFFARLDRSGAIPRFAAACVILTVIAVVGGGTAIWGLLNAPFGQ